MLNYNTILSFLHVSQEVRNLVFISFFFPSFFLSNDNNDNNNNNNNNNNYHNKNLFQLSIIMIMVYS